MRYVYLANNTLGERVLRWLVGCGDAPVGLVVHEHAKARRRELIVQASGLGDSDVIDDRALVSDGGIAWLRDRRPDLLVSVLFGVRLTREIVAIPGRGAVNLHPALLPFNRGAYPNVWCIVDRTPAGATLHYMDEGIDTGDLIAQRPVPVRPVDTGASLYERLMDAAFELFVDTWPQLVAGTAPRTKQPSGGTRHRVREVEQIDRIDPERLIRAGDLIDIIRARTFPPHKGAYIDLGGRRVFLRLELSEEDV